MAPKVALDAVDRLLRDLKNTDRPFGGTAVLLGGDFRLTLRIVKHGNRVSIVGSTIKFIRLWTKFRQFKLCVNKRAQDDDAFAAWLENVGDGNLPIHPKYEDTIQIPKEMLEENSLVDSIFGSVLSIEKSASRAILCPKNDDAESINNDILKKVPGDVRTYKSIDSIVTDEEQEQVNFSVEFLNSLTPSGMAPHCLNLKVGSIIMLLRNLNTKRNLCNGTRLIVRVLMPHVIHAEIITGNAKGQQVFVPRIDLIPSDADLPFTLKRRQFPVKLAWAMTINKSQGQTLEKVGLYFPKPVLQMVNYTQRVQE